MSMYIVFSYGYHQICLSQIRSCKEDIKLEVKKIIFQHIVCVIKQSKKVNKTELTMYVLASDFFQNKSDNYPYLYIRNLENSPLDLCFGTQYPLVFVWAGREY